MKNKNKAAQYFHQKDFSVLDIILLILAVTSATMLIFVRGGGPMGLLILLICICAFIICRSQKIKDDEIDQILKKIMEDNRITYSDSTIACFDLRNTIIKKRKDGKWISPNYYITDILTDSDGGINFSIYAIDLINASVKITSHSLNSTEQVALTEETIKTNKGPIKMSYLKINSNCLIPVTLNDYKSFQIVENICNRYEKK